MNTFVLPPAVADLVIARNRLREHYAAVGLTFNFDGNLVGDLGEAIAVELFGIELVKARSTIGIDGHAGDGRSVQVKATGVGGGPAFRCIETKADHLVFLDLDFERLTGQVIFNGPEHIATVTLPKVFTNQRQVSPFRIRAADAQVLPEQRLPRVDL